MQSTSQGTSLLLYISNDLLFCCLGLEAGTLCTLQMNMNHCYYSVINMLYANRTHKQIPQHPSRQCFISCVWDILISQCHLRRSILPADCSLRGGACPDQLVELGWTRAVLAPDQVVMSGFWASWLIKEKLLLDKEDGDFKESLCSEGNKERMGKRPATPPGELHPQEILSQGP